MPHKTRRLVFAVALIVLSAAVGWALGSAPQPAAALAAASPGQDAQTAMDMAMPGSFFNPGPFMPHGGCYLWTQSLILLHTLSDGAIGVAYYCIPIILLYFVRRRQDLKFKWIFVLFAAFVMACGTTHLMEVWNIWHADYWLAGFVKAFTALVSVGTTLLLIKLMPVALALPSAEELRKAHAELEIRVMERTAELAQTNRSLVEEITERKRTEAGLIESERRYHDLFANMNEGLAHCRMIIEGDRPVDFVYLAVNDMFTTLTGLKDVVGKRITELIPGIRESDPDFFEIYGRVAMTGKPEKHEQYLKALSAWLALSVYSTEPSCFVVIFDVITKRKQAEIALRETNEYLDNLFKYANAPIIVWDPRFHITRFNHAFESLTGRTAAEVIGQSLEILFPPGKPSGRYLGRPISF